MESFDNREWGKGKCQSLVICSYWADKEINGVSGLTRPLFYNKVEHKTWGENSTFSSIQKIAI